ncbi:piggyBac transposable element-derived protein 4-like [Stegodyphus dumicola]|uniref:piggyBac transposable element-derived protein 4-like n=1 Tax=Stegodyphus dumicola TaxID=202533 RepID=UPI0015B2E706|nr:piggyBac transposable element-derived protein 4-like [Stegodyphus dumicola]
MHILMGIHQLPELKNYWSTDPILSVQSVARIIIAKRFKKVTDILHVNDNSTNPCGQLGHDKLDKIRAILSQLNDSIPKVYEPSSALGIDECMIAFKGRTSLKQYMPMKPIKRGYKMWCLADSKSGYIQKFEIYCGKETSDNKGKILSLGETN